jgi:sugar phosphate isomerase/epimerase
VPETLKKVQSYGIKHVELAGTYNLTPDRFLELLKEHGLTAVSGHFGYDQYKADPAKVAAEAKALGLKYAGCAWISHERGKFDEAKAREAAAVFNQAGEALAKEGIQFFYHCHGYEFQPHGDGTYMDLIIKETDPKKVAYQMDVFWVVHPGADPVKYLNNYPGRWLLMHVKDMKRGVKGDFTGLSDVKNDVIVGTGQMDWPAILAAAQKSGVKWYFIEDESPTAADQIPRSLKYLAEVKF